MATKRHKKAQREVRRTPNSALLFVPLCAFLWPISSVLVVSPMNQSAASYETRYADAPVPQPTAAPSLLDAVLAATGDAPTPQTQAHAQTTSRLDRFLAATDVGEAV